MADSVCGLARSSVVCPLGGHVRKCPFVARSYDRCCMYGPNYVKLSRGFAVQLVVQYVYWALCRATPEEIL
jgi:hypothetical protein